MHPDDFDLRSEKLQRIIADADVKVPSSDTVVYRGQLPTPEIIETQIDPFSVQSLVGIAKSAGLPYEGLTITNLKADLINCYKAEDTPEEIKRIIAGQVELIFEQNR